jgi:hypothetical protein
MLHQAINRWNGIYGRSFKTVVVPISWGSHAAAEFGQPPQEILNGQIVDNSLTPHGFMSESGRSALPVRPLTRRPDAMGLLPSSRRIAFKHNSNASPSS